MAVSRILPYALASFLFGVAAASFFSPIVGIGRFLSISAICVLIAALYLRRPRAVFFAIAFFCFALGVLRFGALSAVPPEIFSIADTHTTIAGFVADEPRVRNSQELTLSVTEINGAPVKRFNVRITARPYPRFTIGDFLLVRGFIERPENTADFNLASYLEKDTIYAISSYPRIEKMDAHPATSLRIKSALLHVKTYFTDTIKSLFHEPHASYLAGLLVGDRAGIPRDLYDAFKATGTAHVVALSGFNISIIALTLLFLFQIVGLPYVLSGILLSVSIIVFSIMVGGEASIVRAAIMGIIAVMAGQNFRMYDSGRALLGAAFLMVFADPKLLRFDIGFQLSCAATAGIIFIAPLIERHLTAIRSAVFRASLSATLAAEAAVTPLLILHFGSASLIAPLANILILPTIPYAMLFGFIAGMIGMISPILSFIAVPFAWLLLTYEISIVSFLARVPFAYAELSFIGQAVFLMLYLYIGGRFIYKTIHAAN